MKDLRGVCPVCGENWTLRKEGRVRMHKAIDSTRANPRVCPGSGMIGKKEV